MSWLENVKVCIAHIYAHDYFVAEWEKVKHKKALEECDKSELLAPFQDLWDLLPDNAACRRPPFFQVCNLAEEFVFGDDE